MWSDHSESDIAAGRWRGRPFLNARASNVCWVVILTDSIAVFFFFSITVIVWQISYTFRCDIHSRDDVKCGLKFVRRKISKDPFIITQIKNAFVFSGAISVIWNIFSLNYSNIFQDDKQKHTSNRIQLMALSVNSFKDNLISYKFWLEYYKDWMVGNLKYLNLLHTKADFE